MRGELALTLGMIGTLSASRVQAAKVDCYADPNTFEGTPGLKIGDPPPKLPKALWRNGQGPVQFERGTVYLVEFWATWCLPCQKSLPHLNELQKTYRRQRLQVLGVNAAENGPEDLNRFLSRVRIDFPVGYVDDEKVFKEWMWAARASGLPWLFLIDREGRLAWWGQPFFKEVDVLVRRVVNGKPAVEQGSHAARIARAQRGWSLKGQAFRAYQSGHYEEALPLLEEAVAIDPEIFWNEVVLKFRILFGQNRAQGIAFADSAVRNLCWHNPQALTAIADVIVGSARPSGSELEVAERAARRAKALTGGANPDVERTINSITFLGKTALSK